MLNQIGVLIESVARFGAVDRLRVSRVEPVRSAADKPTDQLASRTSNAHKTNSIAHLSAPARLLAGILGSDPPEARAMIRSVGHLAQDGIASPEAGTLIAVRLQRSICSSGLFYESHLRQWIHGRLTLETLLREPQVRMWRHDQADLPPLRSLVRQQVDLLSRPVLTWEGELMPAIPLTLNVDWLSSPRGRSAPREGYDGTSDAEPLTRCRTRIQIVLPALGKVTATLVDGPRGFSFDLQCASQRGLRALRSLSEVWRGQVQHKLATEVAVMINRSDISAASR